MATSSGSLNFEKEHILLKSAMSLSKLCLWKMDLMDHTIEISEEAFDLLNILSADFDNSPDYLLDRVLHPDSRQEFFDAINLAIEKNIVIKKDYRIIKADGSEGWVRINGDVSVDEVSGRKVLVGTFLDITDEVLAMNEMKKNYFFLKTLVEALPNPVFYKDDNGLYQFCNDAFLDFTGLGRSQVIGHSVYEVAPPELADVYHAADLRLMEQRGQQEYETSVRSADGSFHDVVFNKATVIGPSGILSGIVGIMQDVTQKNETERQLVVLHHVKDMFIELNYELFSFENISAFFAVMLEKLFTIFSACGRAAILEKMPSGEIRMICSRGYGKEEDRLLTAQILEYCLQSEKKVSEKGLCVKSADGSFIRLDVDGIEEIGKTGSHFSSFLIPVTYEGQLRWIIAVENCAASEFNRSDLSAAEYIRDEIPILIRVIQLYLETLSYARNDHLTGVMCRGYFNTILDEKLNAVDHHGSAALQRSNLCLASFDLNGLKRINDRLGHQAGDIYIQTFVNLLKAHLKGSDLIGRIGGDEFACIIFDTQDEVSASLSAFKEIFEQCEIQSDKGSFRGSFGFGVAAYGTDSTDKEELLQIADQRMYENKRKAELL